MINDKELVSYNQKRYEDNIIEWYKFIVKKKEIIARLSVSIDSEQVLSTILKVSPWSLMNFPSTKLPIVTLLYCNVLSMAQEQMHNAEITDNIYLKYDMA